VQNKEIKHFFETQTWCPQKENYGGNKINDLPNRYP
jgi:hypothetical protein